jgi:CheY-like chemotaxis protein
MAKESTMLASLPSHGLNVGTVLVLEDEVLVAVVIEDLLLDQGAAEVFVCRDADEAQALVALRNVDCAILDVKIGDSDSFGLADDLNRREVPFFFATASGPEAVAERHRHRPILAKPYSNDQLLEFIEAAILAQREELS